MKTYVEKIQNLKKIKTMEKQTERNMWGYRFSVISNQNNKTLGTGFFKSSRKMTKDEQLSFFHQYTHGMYLNKESFVSIDVLEAEA